MKRQLSVFTLLLLLFLTDTLIAQWIQANDGVTDNIIKIEAFDNGRLICTSSGGSVLISDDNGENWSEIFLTDESVVAIDCHENTAIAVSFYGGIYKSEDYGESWQFLNDMFIELRDVEFYSNDKAYVCGYNELAFESDENFIYWNHIPYILGDGYWMRDIEFPDEKNGYIIGDGGEGFKTPNFGYGWFKMNIKTGANLKSVSFPSADTGYICGNNNTILKTTDGGLTWENIFNGSIGDFRGILFLSNEEGYVSGANGVILHSMDGGESWQQETSGVMSHLNFFCYHQESQRLILTGHEGVILYKDLVSSIHANPACEEINKLIINPNPATQNLHFRIINPSMKSGELFIYNSTGTLLQKFELENLSIDQSVDVSKYQPGIYHLSISGNHQEIQQGSFVKQ